MSHRSQQRRRFRRINARSSDASWRGKPPTEKQIQVLRRIERETGQQFPPSIGRGEASDVISVHFSEKPEADRAHRRATRARRRAESKRRAGASIASPDEWRFGVGQSAEEEQAEIRRAMAAGLTERYMAMQAAGRKAL